MKIFGIKTSRGQILELLSTTESGAKSAFIKREWIGEISLPLVAVSLIWEEYYNRGYRVIKLEVFGEVETEPIPDSAFNVLSESSKILGKSKDLTPDPDSI